MKFSYRVGWPLWKLAYRLGFTLSYRYDIYYSPESRDYCALSPDIKGLGAEAKTIEEVVDAMESGALEFVRLDLNLAKKPRLRPLGVLIG